MLLDSFKEKFFFSKKKFLSIYQHSNRHSVQLETMSKSYFIDFIIPFFDSYPLYGIKAISLYKIRLITSTTRGKLNKQTNLTLDSKDRIREIWNSNDIRLLGDGTPVRTHSRRLASPWPSNN